MPWPTVKERVLFGGAADIFSPASLAGFNSGVFPELALAAGGIWQNAAKTTPVTADGELVRVQTCPFSGADFAAASDAARPEYNTDGTYHWFASDGVDDALLRTVALNQPWWFFCAAQISSAGGTIHDGQATNTGYAAQNAGATATCQIFATPDDVISSQTVAAESTILLGGVYNGATSSIYLNGVKATDAVGAINLTGVTVGSRSGFPSEKTDRLYAWCCGTGTPSDADFERLRAYFAGFAP